MDWIGEAGPRANLVIRFLQRTCTIALQEGLGSDGNLE